MTFKMAFTCMQVLLMVGMLVTGSINTLSKKAQNDCIVAGAANKSANNTATPHQFDHPWFQTWIMFIGESICLVGLCLHRKRERDTWRKSQSVVNEEGSKVDPPQHPRIIQLIIAIPTVCDLIGTSLAGIGLVYVDASVWQMLRGSIIIFAGILSKIFLKRKLRGLHWTGMVVTMLGLILVGCSSVFKPHGKTTTSQSKTVLGIVLILGSQIVSASQMVIEELFLKKRNFHPLHVVGMEGTYGVLMMTAAVLPAMYFIPGSDVNNSYENSLDALRQIGNSPRLLAFCLLYLTSIAFYNYFGLAVTRSLTAVHRTLIDACRTMLVWGVDLIIYYAFDKMFTTMGQCVASSVKELGLLVKDLRSPVDGFAFLLIGTALYNHLIHVEWIPFLRRPPQEMSVVVSPARNKGGNIQDVSSSEDDDEANGRVSERSKLIKNKKVRKNYS